MRKSPFGILEDVLTPTSTLVRPTSAGPILVQSDEPKMPPRPKSASSTMKKNRATAEKYGLSLDDWNKLLKQCEDDSFRFPFLKKGSKSRRYEETTAPNYSETYLRKVTDKKEKEDEKFNKKLEEETREKELYIHKCIEEVNELCHELEFPQRYAFFNEKAVMKSIPRGVSFTPTKDHSVLNAPASPFLTSKNGKTKIISLGKFNKEHEEILSQFKAMKRDMNEVELELKLRKLSKKTFGEDMEGFESESEEEAKKAEEEIKKSIAARRGLPVAKKPTTPVQRVKSMATEDEYEMHSIENSPKKQISGHQSLNELQKRSLVQTVQQQIMKDLQEKDRLLKEQYNEVQHRGWNKSLR